MGKNSKTFVLLLVLLAFLSIVLPPTSVKAQNKTIIVPNDYPTIQDAINGANNGDIIRISAGRYYEGVIVNKSVSVIGESPDTTKVYGTVEGYQQNNVGNPFHISADNVIIENIAIIQGDEYHGAIRAIDCQNPVIRSNFIGFDMNYGFYSGIGIAVENCTNFSITNNTIQGGGHIEIRNSVVGVVARNTLTNLEYSMLVFSSPNIRFTENLISQCEEGIQLNDSPNAILNQNRVSSVNGAISGISLSKCQESVLTENEVTNCTGGISISESGGCTLRSNTIAERPLSGSGGHSFDVFGYELEDFELDIDKSNMVDGKPIYYLVNLQSVTIDPSGYPNAGYLALINCRDLTVEGFSLGNSSQEILLAQTTNSQISNNNISNSGAGIYLASYSDGNLIYKNKFQANDQSIRSYYSYDNTILDNNMTNSGTVWLDTSSNYTVIGNNLGGFKLVQADNIIAYHNNFMKSSYYLGEQYTSNIGFPTGGSYHVDYQGVDLKSGISQGVPGPDGIGDTAYLSDYYPLIAPVYFFDAGTWGGKTIYVELESNSTLFNFKIDAKSRSISFSASGSAGSVGFVRSGIPKIISQDAWGGDYQIIVNGKSRSFSTFADSQNEYAYASYPNQDLGSSSFPMVIWWAILLLTLALGVGVAVAVIVRHRKTANLVKKL